MSEHDWSAFACPNPDCPAYGDKGQGNLRPHGWSSKERGIRCLRCTTCGQMRPSAVETMSSAAAITRFQRYGATNRRSRRYIATEGRFFSPSPRMPNMNM